MIARVSSGANFFIEKRWALIAISLGVIAGFGSALVCIAWNLVIFGFNIMYIVSPLLAGFIETVIARRKYGKSTGAISALLTFLIINGYGWFAPGWLFPKEPVTLSLITVIAIILTIQAAFPIFVNYLLFVTSLGIVRKFIGFLIFLPSKIMKIPPKEKVKVKPLEPAVDEIFLDSLDTPLTSIPSINGGKIKKYIGLVTGEAVAQENESEGKLDMLTRIIDPTPLEDMNLGEAKKLALSRMMDDAKSRGANAVIEFKMDYVSMGGLQGSALIVAASGTAVLYE